MKVIVVGAGISGLAAAHTLASNDLDVWVLEESSLPGGRTRGSRRDGFVLDHGAQFFMKNYDTTLSLVDELTLEGDVVPQKHKSLLWVDDELIPNLPAFDARNLLRAPKWIAGPRSSLLRAQLQTAKLLFEVFKRRKTLDFVRYEDALDLDGEFLSEFVLRHGGERALELVFQPMISGITLGNAEEIGALYGVALFWNLMQGNWVLKNGIQSLPERLYDRVETAVQLSTPVSRIVLEDDRARGVETRQGFMEADAVICATTATVARHILPDLPASLRSTLDRVRYRPCCHVMFAYDRPVIPDGFDVVGFPRKAGCTMSAIADSAGASESYAPPGASLIHCYTYDRFAAEFNRLPDEEIISALKAELKRYFPGIPDSPMFCEVHKWNEAMCFAPPGMYAAVNRLKQESGRKVEGLYFAGDYLNLASVEGSARSGVDAAEAIVKGL
jgi:oxygen-dependent protoporphyrinogen oxidase